MTNKDVLELLEFAQRFNLLSRQPAEILDLYKKHKKGMDLPVEPVAQLIVDKGAYLERSFIYAKENIRPAVFEQLADNGRAVFVFFYDNQGFYYADNKVGIIKSNADHPMVQHVNWTRSFKSVRIVKEGRCSSSD